MNVSRGTFAKPVCGGRKYVSAYRRRQGELTREALVKATLLIIGRGNFRPDAREIAGLAGVHQSAVNRHFGSVDLLYRVIAREYAQAVCQAAIGEHQAWLIMVGKKRGLS
jgi:AcrR family transcriptional regulator